MVDGSVIKANASIYKMKEREEKRTMIQAIHHHLPHAHSKDGLSVNDFRKRGIGGKKDLQ